MASTRSPTGGGAAARLCVLAPRAARPLPRAAPPPPPGCQCRGHRAGEGPGRVHPHTPAPQTWMHQAGRTVPADTAGRTWGRPRLPWRPHPPLHPRHRSPPRATGSSPGLGWLPSSTTMARRPSGDSPTHLMLYRVARGRVLDLLLREKTRTMQLASCHQRGGGPPARPPHDTPLLSGGTAGPELVTNPQFLLKGQEIRRCPRTSETGFGDVGSASGPASQEDSADV